MDFVLQPLYPYKKTIQQTLNMETLLAHGWSGQASKEKNSCLFQKLNRDYPTYTKFHD
jgi:hypothetical protein